MSGQKVDAECRTFCRGSWPPRSGLDRVGGRSRDLNRVCPGEFNFADRKNHDRLARSSMHVWDTTRSTHCYGHGEIGEIDPTLVRYYRHERIALDTFLARNIQINTSDWRLFEHRADKEWLFRAVVIGICWCSWWLTFMTKHERSVLHADNKLLDANGYHWSGYNTLRFSNFRTLLFSYDRFTIRRTVILTNEISENRNAIKLYVQIWIYSDVFVFVRTKVVT